MPDFSYENQLIKQIDANDSNVSDFPSCILGLDEVGRGCIAGPVVAAGVMLKPSICPDILKEIKDSKKLSKTKRVKLFNEIKEHSYYAISEIDVGTIDRINILKASLLAMSNSLQELLRQEVEIKGVLIDGNHKFDTHLPTMCLVKGDDKSYNIAAASIIAKVYRDNLMSDLSNIYSQYDWHKNAGYATKAHLEALQKYGYTKEHRQSFEPIKTMSLIQDTTNA